MGVDYDAKSGYGWLIGKEDKDILVKYLHKRNPSLTEDDVKELFCDNEISENLNIEEVGYANYGNDKDEYYIISINNEILKECLYSEKNIKIIVENIIDKFNNIGISFGEIDFIAEVYMW